MKIKIHDDEVSEVMSDLCVWFAPGVRVIEFKEEVPVDVVEFIERGPKGAVIEEDEDVTAWGRAFDLEFA